MGAQDKRDYYEVLGVARSATPDQIKQAYHQLAMQWHPDRNPAPTAAERFKEIAEAYAVLSDPTKRNAYDATGHAGISERWSTEDIFQGFDYGDFFGGRFENIGQLFGDFFPGFVGPRRPRVRGNDIHINLTLTLDEAAEGGERKVSVTKSERCSGCDGSGAKPGTKPEPCPECKGSGELRHVQSQKGMKVMTLTTCTRCRGSGIFIASPCSICQGSGTEQIDHPLKLKIPPGIGHGTQLRLAGQGEAGPQGSTPGDLLVRVYIAAHPSLKRDGDDLYAVQRVTFPDAALGADVQVLSICGETVCVAVPVGTQPGTLLRVRGKGMPRFQGKGRGDLYVVVEVLTPTNLSVEERDLLTKLAQLEHERDKAEAAS